jgi:dephospho-CoA kinase
MWGEIPKTKFNGSGAMCNLLSNGSELMKIGIAGRMASGKTTLANQLQIHFESQGLKVSRPSLAAKVKSIGQDLFGMIHKDRHLLQQIGMKMREIRPNVWIDYVNRSIDEDMENGLYDVAILDDIRFVNESENLFDEDWMIIRLNISDELQMARLQRTYEDWEVHWNNRSDASEQEVHLINPDELVADMNVDDSDKSFIDALKTLSI